jgi:uroporphyrinogen-III synthase
VLAERPGERVAIEIETGKSDIKANLTKLQGAGFDRIVFVATSPSAVAACQRAIRQTGAEGNVRIEQLTWLDVS